MNSLHKQCYDVFELQIDLIKNVIKISAALDYEHHYSYHFEFIEFMKLKIKVRNKVLGRQ